MLVQRVVALHLPGLAKGIPPAFLLGVLVAAAISLGVVIIPGLLSPQADFSVTVTPSPVIYVINNVYTTRYNGYTGYPRIDIRSLHNFTGIVSLKIVASAELRASLLEDTVLLGSEGTARWYIEPSNLGNFTLTVIATSGTRSHSTSISVVVQKMTGTAVPGSLSLVRGSTANDVVSLTTFNGLAGSFNLNVVFYIPASTFCDQVGNLTISVNPANLSISQDSTATAIVTISTANVAFPYNCNPVQFIVTLEAVKGDVEIQTSIGVRVYQ